ncbi:serine protease [Cohnella sp. AR92]|nr:serine protease [Cohnella sp. AR92]
MDLNSLLKQIQNGGYNYSNGGNWYTGGSNGWTGNTGSGNTGSGNTGSGNTGSGNTGSGNTGNTNSGSNSGNIGSGSAGNTGSGSGSTGNAGSGSGSTSGSTGSGSGTTQSDFATQVITLVNKERAAAGLSALKSDSKLTQVALAKAKDMYNNNYFDHNSPTYGSPFDMMKQFGVSYSYAGENIAKGQQNPQAVMTAWMNSSGHKANILGGNYSSIGVAYYNGVWVQEFTG